MGKRYWLDTENTLSNGGFLNKCIPINVRDAGMFSRLRILRTNVRNADAECWCMPTVNAEGVRKTALEETALPAADARATHDMRSLLR